MSLFGWLRTNKRGKPDATKSGSYETILSSAAELETKGDSLAALAEYERATKLNHERHEAYLRAAEIVLNHSGVWKDHKQVVTPERAVQYLKDALSWEQDCLPVLECLFRAQRMTRHYNDAVITASRLVDVSPDRGRWLEEGRDALDALVQSGQGPLLRMQLGSARAIPHFRAVSPTAWGDFAFGDVRATGLFSLHVSRIDVAARAL